MQEFIQYSVALATGMTSLLFLRAGAHKLADRGRFQGVLAAYRLTPDGALPSLAIIIPALELLIAVLLAVAWTQRIGAAGAVVMLCVYGAAMTISLVRGNHLIDCGCGDEPEQLGWRLVGRNVALSIPMVAGTLGVGAWGSASESAVIWALSILVMGLWFMSEKAFANLHRMQTSLSSGASVVIGGTAR